MVSLDKQDEPVPDPAPEASAVPPIETWRVVVMLALLACTLLSFFLFPISISAVISLAVAGVVRVLANPRA